MIAYDNASIAEQDEKGKITAAKKKGKEENKIEMIIEMYNDELPIERIAKIAKITTEEVMQMIENQRKKQKTNLAE